MLRPQTYDCVSNKLRQPVSSDRRSSCSEGKGLARIGALSLCLSALFTLSAYSQGVPTSADRLLPASSSAPAAPKKKYTAASVRALPGQQCKIYPAGSSPAAAVTVFTDDDGYARFHAVRSSAGDDLQQLVMDCSNATGQTTSYPIDLTSDDTFASRPVDLANESGRDRPALKGDAMSYSQHQLIEAGYGLRPDPAKAAAAYARWLAAAVRPGRMLNSKRPEAHSHGVTTTSSPAWVGSVLTGEANYVSTEATFNVPTGTLGGDGTSTTEISIWNGLGGYGTGSGLIQGGVTVQTTPAVARYASWREYCCGDPNSNGYGGAFVPNPGDRIYSQEWYCDANGNPNINGGYGCTYLQNLTSGAVLSCTSASGSPCWSVPALPLCSASPQTPNCMTLGSSAEFVIENQSPQVSTSSTAFTDFTPQVTIKGSALSLTTGNYSTITTDPSVYLLTDFTDTTTHILVSLGGADETYFNVQLSPKLKTNSITTVSWGSNQLDLFGLGTDGQMYHKSWNGSVWLPSTNGWEPLGGVFNSSPAAVAWGPNRLDIFGLGTDNQMYHKAWDGSSWYPSPTGWEPLGGRFNSPPAVASWGPNRLDIFGLGTDNQMYHKAWDGNGWYPTPTDWEPLHGVFNSTPAVVSWGPNRLDIFGLGTDNQMYHKAWDGHSWYPSGIGWEPLRGVFNSRPTAVSWGNNRIDLFGLGTDDQMYHKAWNGSGWYPSATGWEALGGAFNSPPAAVSWGTNRIDIFGLGSDYQMYHKAWDGSAWYPSETDWEPLGGVFSIPPI